MINKRKEQIKKLRDLGWTYQNIGKKLGITRQWVHQIHNFSGGRYWIRHAPYATNEERVAALRASQKKWREKIRSNPELLEKARKKQRDYCLMKYNSDPQFKKKKLEANQRYRQKVRKIIKEWKQNHV